jgi:excisionase family DNA binding protein
VRKPGTDALDLAQRLAGLLELPARISALEDRVTGLTESVERLRRALPSTFVPVPEAARVLGVSVATLRRRIRKGEVPVTRIGRAVRIDLTELRSAAGAEVTRLADAARRPR